MAHNYLGVGNNPCGESEDFWNSFDEYWNECGGWYEEQKITKEEFKQFPLSNGFNKGDIIVLYSKNHLEVGDVIVFWASWSPHREPVIHRIVKENGSTFRTKGDHNAGADPTISEDEVIGKAWLRIPWLGWVKIWFVQAMQGLLYIIGG